jgi:hypothetical protein
MSGAFKKKGSEKFGWGLPDEICRLNPKSKKNYRNIKSTSQNENKRMFSSLKVKRSQKFVWGPDGFCPGSL